MDNLEKLYSRVSLEARAQGDASVFGVQYGHLIQGLTDFTNGLVGNGVFGFANKFSVVKTNADFMSIRKKTVYRPLHLHSKATVLELVKVAEDNFNAQADIESRVFAPFRAMLANFLTNPSEMQRLYDVKDLDKGKLIKFSDLSGMEKDLKKVYNPSTSKASGEFGELYRNVGEWNESHKRIGKLNEAMVSMNFDGIIRQAKELHEMAGKLADYIASGDPEYKASPSTMEVLAAASYRVGKELEFLGATGSIVDAIAGSISATADVLKEG